MVLPGQDDELADRGSCLRPRVAVTGSGKSWGGSAGRSVASSPQAVSRTPLGMWSIGWLQSAARGGCADALKGGVEQVPPRMRIDWPALAPHGAAAPAQQRRGSGSLPLAPAAAGVQPSPGG